MNQILFNNDFSARKTRGSFARLGAKHGYRFDVDSVRLNAMFSITDQAAHSRSWALQLWACPEVPTSLGQASHHLVAEVALPPIGELVDDAESFEMNVPATLPAGRMEHVMVLALVAGRNGQFNEVHDTFTYPYRESFSMPRLSGASSYEIKGDKVVLTAERIENPRCAENLSGTLALELWALPAQYQGGAFSGQPLAGVAFDPLAGQYEYRDLACVLPFVAPAAGQWNLVLMLREWTGNGYVTRDFVNFSRPFVQPQPAKIEVPQTAKTTTEASAPAAKAAAKSAARPASAKREVTSAKDDTVSVNSASAEELAEVKGLPTKVAKAIVKERPFRALDELLRVKGMGEKLFAKLRSRLKL